MVGRLQADLLHLGSPLPFVIAAGQRLAVGLLPDMRHFKGEGGQDLLRPCGPVKPSGFKASSCAASAFQRVR